MGEMNNQYAQGIADLFGTASAKTEVNTSIVQVRFLMFGEYTKWMPFDSVDSKLLAALRDCDIPIQVRTYCNIPVKEITVRLEISGKETKT